MAESGIADYVTTFWTGVVVPAGTPPDIVNKLNAAINDGLKSPPVHDSLAKVGAQPAPGSPQDFGELHRRRDAQMGRDRADRRPERAVGDCGLANTLCTP